jgi:putative transcriptional regulator
MTDTIDTIDVLMARFVAGTLPLPMRVLVESHLEISSANRGFVRGLEALAGDALLEAPLASLSDPAHVLEAVFASRDEGILPPRPAPSGSVFPPALRAFAGFEAGQEVPWRTMLPGIREHVVARVEGCRASLFRFNPGRELPDHTHEGTELTLVLEGAFSDQRGRFGRGDVSVADPSLDHRPVAENDRPCIAFIVTDAPLKMTGPLHERS